MHLIFAISRVEWREVVTSRCHNSKIFGWQQTKTSLKKWIRTVSNFIDLNQFHLICQMLAKFSGLNPKGPYVSLEKEKQNFCVVLTYSIKRAREIRKFHVAVVQQRPRNVQKSVISWEGSPSQPSHLLQALTWEKTWSLCPSQQRCIVLNDNKLQY